METTSALPGSLRQEGFRIINGKMLADRAMLC